MAIGDTPTVVTLETLLKIKQQNLKEFVQKAREVASAAIEQKRIYTVFRIAKELQELYCDVEEMEDFIISTKNAHYIYRFAREIRGANILKLQQAMVETKDYNYIAGFACFIGEANVDLLENIVIQSNNARAAYTLLRFGKYPNIQKLKPIFIKSKRPRYLYALAKLSNDPTEISFLQDLVCRGRSNLYVRLFAAHIPGADIKKLEDRVLMTKNFEEIKKFAKLVKSDRLYKIIMIM